MLTHIPIIVKSWKDGTYNAYGIEVKTQAKRLLLKTRLLNKLLLMMFQKLKEDETGLIPLRDEKEAICRFVSQFTS